MQSPFQLLNMEIFAFTETSGELMITLAHFPHLENGDEMIKIMTILWDYHEEQMGS